MAAATPPNPAPTITTLIPGQTRYPSVEIAYANRVTAPVVVIMAAGEGTRMRSQTPKLLHPLCGRPMIAWSVAAAKEAGARRVVIVESPKRDLEAVLDHEVEFA